MPDAKLSLIPKRSFKKPHLQFEMTFIYRIHTKSIWKESLSIGDRNVMVSIVTCAGVVQRQNISFPS